RLGKSMLELPRRPKNETHHLAWHRLLIEKTHRLEHGSRNQTIDIITTKLAVSTRAFDLKDAVIQRKNGDVERASTQVVDGKGAGTLLVKAVGQRRCGRFVDQPQHLKPRKLRRVASCLALGVVEVCRNGDHRAANVLQMTDSALLEAT